jgi:hypothetical protein
MVFLGSLIGIAYLYFDKNYLAAVFLGLTLAYFTFLAGFSFWQGSRIYFPSGMASSTLLVYAAYRVWPQLKRWTGRRSE